MTMPKTADITDITECSRVSPPDEFPTEMAALTEYVKKMNPHLFIAVPCYGCKMGIKFTTSLLRLEGFCLSNGIKLTIEFLGNESLITRGRCILAERAMKSDATHLFFIDADIGFEVHTVLRLIAFGAPITSAVYAKKGLNFGDVINASSHEPARLMDAALNYNINLDPGTTSHSVQSGFLKVLDTATGFLLIRMDALRRLREIYAPTHMVKNDIPSSRETLPEYVALFETVICEKTRRFLSEDYSFCRKAQANGFDVYVDITAPLTHTGEIMNHGDLSHLLQTNITI